MWAPKCAACGGDRTVRNLYSLTKDQHAIREPACASDPIGNLPPVPGIFPDYQGPMMVASGEKKDEGGFAA
jgi:hypothetical protein